MIRDPDQLVKFAEAWAAGARARDMAEQFALGTDSHVYAQARVLGLPNRGRLTGPKSKGMTERPCMCCRRPFQSGGAHHRMCRICKLEPSEGAGYALAGVSLRG